MNQVPRELFVGLMVFIDNGCVYCYCLWYLAAGDKVIVSNTAEVMLDYVEVIVVLGL